MFQIKTIQYPDIPIKTRYLFLKHLQRQVHEFALNRQDAFLEAGQTAEHFHRDKKNKKKTPVVIHGITLEGCFALRAYTRKGIESLMRYQELFQSDHPNLTENCVESSENCCVSKTRQPLIYQSENWIPYRDCRLKNGFYYDMEKDRVANFDDRLKGNLKTFLSTFQQRGENHVQIPRGGIKILELIPKKQTRIALLTEGREIKKHAFKVKVSIDYRLPQILSLGQNSAYGNGIFHRVK